MAENPRFCDHCGAANRDTGKFCVVCGQSLLLTSPASGMATLSSSLLLKQRYQILSPIGQGGFGKIYQAEDVSLHQAKRAIKEIRVQHLDPQERQEAVASFQQEAQLLASLMHPNLPRIYDHFEAHSCWYLVMDYIEGETLEDRLLLCPQSHLPLPDVLAFALQLCTVLHYLHSRQPPIIFRDLKPANVMVTKDDHLYLIDFGIARLFKPGQAKDTLALGSPGFAAPEQYGKAQTTERADVYSLGATLHFLLSGRDPSEEPFNFPALPSDLDARIRSPLDKLIQDMVAFKKEQRPANIQVVRDELLRIEKLSAMPSAASHVVPSLPPPTTAHQSGPRNTPPATMGSGAVAQPLPGSHAASSSVVNVSATAAAKKPPLTAGQSSSQKVSPVTPSGIAQSVPGNGVLLTGSHNVGDLLYTYRGHQNEQKDYLGIRTIHWSPDSKRIATLGTDTSHIWETTTGHVISQKIEGEIVWSPDGQRFAQLYYGSRIRIYDANTYRKLQQWAPPPWAISRDPTWSEPVLSPNGKYLLLERFARETDKEYRYAIYVFNLSSGEVLAICPGDTNHYYTFGWSPDGKYIVSASDDRTVKIWQLKPRKNIFRPTPWRAINILTYREHDTYGAWAAAWSPDGKYLASGGVSGELHIWHAATGAKHLVWKYASTIHALSWSPDGTRIASGGDDQTVRIWDAQTGTDLYRYTGHAKKVEVVSWSPDGTRIASGGKDKTVQIWWAQ